MALKGARTNDHLRANPSMYQLSYPSRFGKHEINYSCSVERITVFSLDKYRKLSTFSSLSKKTEMKKFVLNTYHFFLSITM